MAIDVKLISNFDDVAKTIGDATLRGRFMAQTTMFVCLLHVGCG
jgi:hypothetical protein